MSYLSSQEVVNQPTRKDIHPVGAIDLIGSTGIPVAAVGAGGSPTGGARIVDLGRPCRTFAVQGVLSTGGSTAVSVGLQGSIDGTLWNTLGASTLATLSTSGPTLVTSTSSTPVVQIRALFNSVSTLASTETDEPAGIAYTAVAVP